MVYFHCLLFLFCIPFFIHHVNGYTKYVRYDSSWLSLNQSIIVLGNTNANTYYLKGYSTTQYYGDPIIHIESTDVEFLKIAENSHELKFSNILVKQSTPSHHWTGCRSFSYLPPTTHYLYRINFQQPNLTITCEYPIPEEYDEFMSVTSTGYDHDQRISFSLFYKANNVSRTLFQFVNSFHEIIHFELDPNEKIIAIDTDRTSGGVTDNFYFLTEQNVYVANLHELIDSKAVTKPHALFHEEVDTINFAFNIFSNEYQVLVILNNANQLNFYRVNESFKVKRLGTMSISNSFRDHVEFYFEVPTEPKHNYSLYLTNGHDFLLFSTVTNPYELTNHVKAFKIESNVIDTAGIRKCTKMCQVEGDCVIKAHGDYCKYEFNYVPYIIAIVCVIVMFVMFGVPLLICLSYILNKRVYESAGFPKKVKEIEEQPSKKKTLC
mmetsp:Transcript_4712/g.6983  ORF Transcript_4712/g.6983 Transcript_4712/m.6983 type:complete len:436 (-) Transcript_4712:261-1568(-)